MEGVRVRSSRTFGLATLVTAAVLLTAGCSLGGDDDDGGSEAAGTQTGATTTTGGGGGGGQGGNVLGAVQSRGTLNCGVNEAVPGFGFVTEGGEFQGFDIDYCRVVAAAVLGDADAVEYKPLTAEQRFTALQSGEIDVLIRNTTRTASRDGSEGATFLTTTFYDGQGMMVRADSDYQELEDSTSSRSSRRVGSSTPRSPSRTTTRFSRRSRPSAATRGRPTSRSSQASARTGRRARAAPRRCASST
jgi:general L-amino acid transport system substrate-binding protein